MDRRQHMPSVSVIKLAKHTPTFTLLIGCFLERFSDVCCSGLFFEMIKRFPRVDCTWETLLLFLMRTNWPESDWGLKIKLQLYSQSKLRMTDIYFFSFSWVFVRIEKCTQWCLVILNGKSKSSMQYYQLLGNKIISVEQCIMWGKKPILLIILWGN